MGRVSRWPEDNGILYPGGHRRAVLTARHPPWHRERNTTHLGDLVPLPVMRCAVSKSEGFKCEERAGFDLQVEAMVRYGSWDLIKLTSSAPQEWLGPIIAIASSQSTTPCTHTSRIRTSSGSVRTCPPAPASSVGCTVERLCCQCGPACLIQQTVTRERKCSGDNAYWRASRQC